MDNDGSSNAGGHAASAKVDVHLAQRDAFARFIGLELVAVAPGSATVRMAIKPEHLNGLDIVHGGAIFSLADYAFAAACNAHGKPTVALQVNVVFLKAAKAQGILTAEARMQAPGKVGQYEVRVTDDAGALIALFHGLSYEKTVKPR